MGLMRSSSSIRRGAALLLSLGFACQTPSGDPAPASGPEIPEEAPAVVPPPVPPPTDALAQPVANREEPGRLEDAFAAALAPEAGLSFEALERRHSPAFLPAHGLDVTSAAHYQEFVEKLELTEAERERLATLGFVVVPARGPGGAGPVDVYYRVFAADLPVFVTADSVLHAWHRSYDLLLEYSESLVLSRSLGEVLDRTRAVLDPRDPAQRDARTYLDVARTLLHGERTMPQDTAEQVRPIIEAIESRRRTKIELLGARVEQDFSQFIPRGHYNHSEELQRYFQAMMWLGRMDLRLWDPKTQAAPNPREEAAARALVAALARSGRQEAFDEIEQFYRLHVGRPNALALADLGRLCTKAGAADCAGAVEAKAMAKQYRAQGTPAVSSAADPSIVSMRLLPQRFAYDSWVTSQTTAPRMPDVEGSGRTMASPYDVAFALGSDRALAQLEGEMDEPYARELPARLAAVRGTLQALPPLELDETIYDHWLQGLMVVGRTDLDERLPRVLRTAAWHDHRLETVLASWAELRHDTVLVVEQSEGFIGCQYPQGYVEPLPELYRQLDEAAAHLVALYEDHGTTKPSARRGDQVERLSESYMAKTIPAWAKHFRTTMKRLARLSEQQLRGEPMSASDLAFMNDTVDKHADDGYGGTRNYDGWYAALYWNLGWTLEPPKDRGLGGTHPHIVGGESEPIVVDVHTDADHGTVLEVATGHPELLVVVIDQGDDVAVYGGPVSSFYSFEKPATQRMTDEQWKDAIQEHALPSRPAFARGYRAE
jgi:hypothetical protein